MGKDGLYHKPRETYEFLSPHAHMQIYGFGLFASIDARGAGLRCCAHDCGCGRAPLKCVHIYPNMYVWFL